MNIRIYSVTVTLIDQAYKQLPSRKFMTIAVSPEDAKDRVRKYLLDDCAILSEASIAGWEVYNGATEDLIEVA